MRKKIWTALIFPFVVGTLFCSAGAANAATHTDTTHCYSDAQTGLPVRYGGVDYVTTYMSGGGELEFDVKAEEKIKNSSYVILRFFDGTSKSYTFTSNNGGHGSGTYDWTYSNVTDHPNVYAADYYIFEGPDGAVNFCHFYFAWVRV